MNSNTDIATTAAAALSKSLGKSSLGALVKATTRRSLLLVDCSGSMSSAIANGTRRIDALRTVATDLRKTHPVPVVAFGLRGGNPVDVVEGIPEPQGSTPVDLAIEFAQREGANHAVLITDGEPNDSERAFAAARAFGGVIDVFFIGDPGDHGAHFCKALAKMAGGTYGCTDLGAPKELSSKIAGLLGDGGL